MIENLIKIILIVVFTLNVLTTANEKVIYAQVGESVSLKPPEDIKNKYTYWYFGKDNGLQLAWLNPFGGRKVTQVEPWNRKLSLSTHALTVTNFQEEFFGEFFCKVTLNGEIVSSSTKYKLIKLSVIATPTSLLLLPGESLSLGCDVGTPQNENIHWINPQKEREHKNHETVSKVATSEDHGLWTCVVENEARAQVFITVIDLFFDPPRQYTSTNSPLSIPCSLRANITWEQVKEKGAQKIQWHFLPKPSLRVTSIERQRLFILSVEDPLTWKVDEDRGLRPAPDLKTGNFSLTRDQGVEGDRGDYVCSFTFRNGVTLSRSVHVDILQIVSSVGTNIRSGQEVNLSCSTAESLPSDAMLRWFSPDESELKQSDHHGAHLTIKAAGTGDSGRWRCELWQGHVWLTTEIITLQISEEGAHEVKLGAWMLITICSSAVIFILLLVITLTLCHRRRKRKMKPGRHQFCQCKNPKPKRIS
ncbi:CD4-1 molecule [Gouania willdenowi]|uniref:Uncharacterized LOC114478135 n=1 Tax=Gouania willdenowi TaxID=441366 RepID=A0A8C5HG09_GOUWI|nr:uncharacterized protein LOC114478135 [Gouania willdenowi]